jgi:PAS domain S-box-containing protein
MMKGITLKDVLAAVGIMLVFATLLKEVFGVSVIGKKIYKGAPMLWKWIIRNATYRKEMLNRMDMMLTDIRAVKEQVEYNGGASMKDAVKRIEGLVKFHELRMDILDESNDRMNFRMDDHGACTFINDAFLKFFGYSEKDVLGFSWESIIADEDIEEVREKWDRAIEKANRFYGEYGICDIHGHCHQCVVRAYPICEGPLLKGFYGTIDIKK